MVPLRRKEIFQSDDGRYVEVYTKINEIELVKETVQEVEEGETEIEEIEEVEEVEEEVPAPDKIFVGVVHIPIGNQAKEIKFEITDCETIENAFAKFHNVAQLAAEEYMKMLKEQMEKARNPNIITAGPEALQEIERIEQKNDGPSNIIV